LAQEGVPQSVFESGNPHASGALPLHVAWQAPAPSQWKRPPCGWPEVTVVQVPTLSVTSHAWHWLLQSALQQTPSTQRLLVHS
jgi:hypothetical protein